MSLTKPETRPKLGFRAVQKQAMTQTSSQHRIGIIIPNQCSLLTLGALTEPFARANQILGEDKYQLSYIGDKPHQTITISEPPIPITVTAQSGIEAITDYDCVIVVAEQLPTSRITAKMKKALVAYQQTNQPIVTVQAGWFWLLESGIGTEGSWALHWKWQDEIKARYPELNVRYDGYQQSNNIISCASQQQSLQFILSYLAKYEDKFTIQTIRDEFYINNDDSEQNEDPSINAELPPRLQKAVSLMENNLEDPISTDMIADLVHVSRRQLERLFKRYLDTMPARYYLQLRLKNAQKLLQTTNHSVVQIGLMCGFSSGPHFSSAYKQYFAITPRAERAKRFYATC